MAEEDQAWMTRALELARLGLGATYPNPAVGAVLVKAGEVVGQGWHARAGEPHAEQLALAQAGAQARGATLYVTLEPCCHEGRPRVPCSRQVIEAGVTRVVVGLVDPYPPVCGKGLAQLRSAGVEVAMPSESLTWECARLNRAFLQFVHTGRPLVSMKFASSLDGKIATRTGHSQWISGPEARHWVHQQRAIYQAVLVGLGTVLADDPQLTARADPKSRQPLRIVADSQARLPLTARLLTCPGGEVVIATTEQAPSQRVAALRQAGATVVELAQREGQVCPQALLDYLGGCQLQAVWLEGGGRLNASFLEAGCVHHVVAFLAPLLIGGSGAPGPLGGLGADRLDSAWPLQRMESRSLGADLMVEGYLNCPWLL